MELHDDPVRDSIRHVLQSVTGALDPQRPAWSLYGAPDTAQRQITAAADGSSDPRAYAQRIRRGMQEARQKPTTGVVTQGQVSKTGCWMELTEARHVQEPLDHIQKSDGPPPTAYKEAAIIIILTLHSWTYNDTITLDDKTGPPYARTATCRHFTASAAEVQLDWRPGRDNDEYTMVHTVHHKNAATEEEHPEQTVTEPPRPASEQWPLYKLLPHAGALAEHSIRSYKDITYVERMLQDWPKYETEVLEGQTGLPDTTPRAT